MAFQIHSVNGVCTSHHGDCHRQAITYPDVFRSQIWCPTETTSTGRFQQNAPSGGVSSFDAGIALDIIRLTQPQNGHKTPCPTHTNGPENLFILAMKEFWRCGWFWDQAVMLQPESPAVFCNSLHVITGPLSTSQAGTGAEPLTESRIFPRPRGMRMACCHDPCQLVMCHHVPI